MKIRKGWKVTFSDKPNDWFVYSDTDYAETPELRRWLNASKLPLNKQRVFILS